MRPLLLMILLSAGMQAKAQPVLKAGDPFPNIIIRPLLNAPAQSLDIQTTPHKLLILNFWGTWCSPCIPEMDSLALLQIKNAGQIQVIGISNEPVKRLEKYLQRKPSTLWLASDTTSNLYSQFAFSYVGQSAIIDRQNRIIALVRTDSINQTMIDQLLQGQPIRSSAETRVHKNMENETFGVDSSMDAQVVWSAYRKDLHSMLRGYKGNSFEGRRLTFINMCVPGMYQDLHGLSYQQVIYEVPRTELCNWEQKNRTTFCFDVLVKPEQKDSLKTIMLHLLAKLSPIKTRMEQREIPVYVLRRLPGAPAWKTTADTSNTYSFSGQGFNGKGIPLKPFADYIANELQLPVVDETGLDGRYNIKTNNVLRTAEETRAALQKLGLTVEKTNRKMDVLIIYQ